MSGGWNHLRLLDRKDMDKLRRAMVRGQEISLSKCLGERTEEARTLPAGPPWEVEMVVQLRTLERNIETVQTFPSAEVLWERLRP